jgi:chaperonin GroES
MVFRVMDRSEVQGLTEAKVPELQGARVLVTGIHRACGADIVRAFAGQGARVLVQINDPSLSADALTETASGSVLEVAAQPADGFDGLAATRLAQKAAAAMGALDVAVNVIPFSSLDGDGLASADDLEDVLARKLSAALKSTAVLANRMGLTWTSGLVLNVLTLGGPDDERVFRPLHDRVVVASHRLRKKTAGGIIIPDTAAEKPQEGEVIAVGPGARGDDNEIQALDVKAGDRVLFGKWSGTEVKIDGEDLLIMKESDIMGVEGLSDSSFLHPFLFNYFGISGTVPSEQPLGNADLTRNRKHGC